MRLGQRSLFGMGGILALAFVLQSITGCDGGGGGGGGGSNDGGTLDLMAFDQQDRTDVARNQSLTLHFSANIDPDSVSIEGFQVRAGIDVVQGRVEVRGSTITFYPTVLPGDRNDYNPPNNPQMNGVGFRASARFQVVGLGGSPFSIKTRSGRPLQASFDLNFMTDNHFLPETPNVPPHLVEGPTFFPEPVANPNGDPSGPPNDPNLPVFDPTNLGISFRFSEPMNPGPLNPFVTFTIVNISPPPDPNCPLQVPALNEPILGNVILSPDAMSATFEPLFTLGDQPCTTDPFIFEVTLSHLLTDLAGNPLAEENGSPLTQPLVFHFLTRDEPGEPNFDATDEHFNNTDNRGGCGSPPNGDPLNCTDPGMWLGNGILEGLPVERRTVAVEGTLSAFNLPQPLTVEGQKLQMLYFKTDFEANGPPLGKESFIGMAWGPRSNFVFPSTYGGVTLKLGHTRATTTSGLMANFASNFSGFPVPNPTTVFVGSYTTPSLQNQNYFPWPEFTADFEYSGQGPIVWEANVCSGTDYQLFRNMSTAATPVRRIYGACDTEIACLNPPACNTPFAENTTYFQQFVIAKKISTGVSKYYNSGISNPDYTQPLIVFDASRGGPCDPNQGSGCFRVEWEGADPDPDMPNRPDTENSTGFSPDINIGDGHQFIRFKIIFNGQPFTGVVPVVESVSFAYTGAGGG